MLSRIYSKIRQVMDYCEKTSSPYDLTLDAFRMKRTAFTAVTRGGLKLRLNPSVGEGFTFYENLVRRDYLGGVVLNPGDTVVDIGANIGAFAVLAGSIVGPAGRVIAIEPMPDTFKRLQENLSLNGLTHVIPVGAAVDSRAGELTIHAVAKSALASAHMSGPGLSGGASVTVPCITLDAVFATHQLDYVHLLKIDCEGSEYGIFETLTPALAARIGQIAMEVHPVDGKNTQRLAEQLGDFGFEVICGYTWFAINRAARMHPRPQ